MRMTLAHWHEGRSRRAWWRRWTAIDGGGRSHPRRGAELIDGNECGLGTRKELTTGDDPAILLSR